MVVGVPVYTRGFVVVAAVDDAVAGEFDVVLVLEFLESRVGDQVVEDVFVCCFWAFDVGQFLVFAMLVATVVFEFCRWCCEAGYLDYG